MNKISVGVRVLLILALTVPLAACWEHFVNVPPNDIGMILTPTGYEDKIYSPGQINLGELDSAGQGNTLVLIQRSAFQIKEAFVGADPTGDNEDHRCLTGNVAPMTIDVRLTFALPDYTTDVGKKDLSRIFLLGNPEATNDSRVVRITAESIYQDQTQQQVRSKLRQICGSYADFTTANAAFSNGDLNLKVEEAIRGVMTEMKIPLRLVSAAVSNMKPDQTVLEAISANQAAEQRVKAMQTLTDFLDEDPTGNRAVVYKFQNLQEIVDKAGTNGHNTIYMMDIGGNAQNVLPIPVETTSGPKETTLPSSEPTTP